MTPGGPAGPPSPRPSAVSLVPPGSLTGSRPAPGARLSDLLPPCSPGLAGVSFPGSLGSSLDGAGVPRQGGAAGRTLPRRAGEAGRRCPDSPARACLRPRFALSPRGPLPAPDPATGGRDMARLTTGQRRGGVHTSRQRLRPRPSDATPPGTDAGGLAWRRPRSVHPPAGPCYREAAASAHRSRHTGDNDTDVHTQ